MRSAQRTLRTLRVKYSDVMRPDKIHALLPRGTFPAGMDIR